MRLPNNQSLPLAALILILAAGAPVQARDRTPSYDGTGPQADYPMVLGKPFRVDGVTYTPADTLNYDVVGLAATTTDGGSRITASHRTLPLPSYVEITALETGRTILVRLERRGPMTGELLTELSPGAAEQLGILDMPGAPVRVRRVNPPEPERAALRSGRSAPLRMETPPSLRAVLMRRLEQQGSGTQVSRPGAMPAVPRGMTPVQPGPASYRQRPPAPQPVVEEPEEEQEPELVQIAPQRGNWLVQVGAFSSRQRALAVAAELGARVFPGNGIWRVRLTGFASPAAAQTALAKARVAGYTDARIQRAD